MFVLDDVDSSSGAVFLRIESDSSQDFVDCGHFKRPWILLKHYSFDGPYGEFLLFDRENASLVVRLPVVLTSISPESTRVIVSGSFELKSRQETWGWTAGQLSTWDFSSRNPKTKYLRSPAWGSGQERTCRSTLEAESMTLRTIGKLAEKLTAKPD